MRRLNSFYVCTLLAGLPFVLAVTRDTPIQGVMDTLPACPAACFQSTLKDSACNATDLNCFCMIQDLQTSLLTCTELNCTVREVLGVWNATSTTCREPYRDKSNVYIGYIIAFGVLSFLSVIARFVSKLMFTTSRLGLDDYTIFFAFLTVIASAVISATEVVPNGLGKDIWRVDPDHFSGFTRAFFILDTLYYFQITLIKISILFFYRRIFPTPGITKVIWAAIGFNALYGLGYIIASLTQCRPLDVYWNGWENPQDIVAKCTNIVAMIFSNAGLSIAIDVSMLGIPLSQVYGLKLSMQRKIGVTIMFCVGIIVTVVSIFRVVSIIKSLNSSNGTMRQLAPATWTVIEINTGILCACLPAVRILLVRLLPKWLGSTATGSRQVYPGQTRSAKTKTSGSRSRGQCDTPDLESSTEHVVRSGHPVAAAMSDTSIPLQYEEGDETSLVHLRQMDSSNMKKDPNRYATAPLAGG